MKKRLLSAALALAMVLTLMPVSVLPVSAATTPEGDAMEAQQEGMTVTWYGTEHTYGKDNDGNDVTSRTPGYYAWDANARKLYHAASGVIEGLSAAGGRWHPKPHTVNGTATHMLSSFTLVGDITMNDPWAAYAQSSISVNLNNYNLTISSGFNESNGTKFSNLTVTNTPVTGVADKTKAVTLPDSWKGSNGSGGLSDRSITLNVTNATVAGGITVNGGVGNNYGFSATLTNAALSGAVYVNGVPNNSSSLRLDMRGDSSANSGICATNATLDLDMKAGDSVGGVTCNGKKATIDVNASYSKPASITSITLGNTASENKSGGTINLNSAAHVTGAITTFGQTTINVKDTSTVDGNITFLSGKAIDGVNGAAPNWAGTNINVTGYQTRVGGITQAAGDSLKATVKVDDTATCGAVNLDQYGGTVTVSHATTGAIGMGLGTLTVDNGATVDGAISIGHKGAANATISGENTTVKGVVNPNNPGTTLVINGGKFISTGNVKQELEKGSTTVKGGTFKVSLLGSPVLSNIAYEFGEGTPVGGNNLQDPTYTYVPTGTVNDVFQKLVDMTQDAGGVDHTNIKPASTIPNSGTGVGRGTALIDFVLDHNNQGGQLNTPVSVVRIFAQPNAVIDLPNKVGGRTVTNWYKNENAHKTNYIVVNEDCNGGTPIKLVADSTSAGNNDITAVSLDAGRDTSGTYKGLTISLDASNKVIKLSGLVTLVGNQAVIPLQLVNARGQATLKVDVLVDQQNNQKRVYFTNPSTGLTISGDNSILTVTNSTQQFTLDGSGLVVRDINLPISVRGSGSGTITAGPSVAKVNGGIAGTAGRESYKQALEKNNPFNSATTGMLKDSIAVQQSLNNVLKSVTKSQVDNWLATARRTIATELKDTNSAKYAETYAAWDTIEVEPYLDIVVNNWTNKTGNASSASLDVNLTLKYRVVAVHRANADWPSSITTQDQKNKFERVEVTTGNLTLTGDYGDIQLTLALPDEFAPAGTKLYAHHGN